MKAWILNHAPGIAIVALASIVVGLVTMTTIRSCQKPSVPVHVTPVNPESVQVVVHDTIPGHVQVVVDRDSLIALEKRIQQLTDENESWATQTIALGQQIAVIDSQWSARFDSVAGIITVQVRRGRIDAVQFFRPKYVLTSNRSTWRNTWTLRATPGGGISMVTRRLPFDLGAEISVDGWSDFNATKFGGLTAACLTMRTSQYLSGRAGVGWLMNSGPVIVAGVKLGMEF